MKITLHFFGTGSFTVISAKAVSSMTTITFQGNNQLKYPIFYLMLLVMVVTAVGQVRYTFHFIIQNSHREGFFSRRSKPFFIFRNNKVIEIFIFIFRFLNIAMASHDTTVVVPTNFVFFTMSAILSGK